MSQRRLQIKDASPRTVPHTKRRFPIQSKGCRAPNRQSENGLFQTGECMRLTWLALNSRPDSGNPHPMDTMCQVCLYISFFICMVKEVTVEEPSLAKTRKLNQTRPKVV